MVVVHESLWENPLLVFQHLLHIWSPLSRDLMMLRSIFLSENDWETANLINWCSGRKQPLNGMIVLILFIDLSFSFSTAFRSFAYLYLQQMFPRRQYKHCVCTVYDAQQSSKHNIRLDLYLTFHLKIRGWGHLLTWAALCFYRPAAVCLEWSYVTRRISHQAVCVAPLGSYSSCSPALPMWGVQYARRHTPLLQISPDHSREIPQNPEPSGPQRDNTLIHTHTHTHWYTHTHTHTHTHTDTHTHTHTLIHTTHTHTWYTHTHTHTLIHTHTHTHTHWYTTHREIYKHPYTHTHTDTHTHTHTHTLIHTHTHTHTLIHTDTHTHTHTHTDTHTHTHTHTDTHTHHTHTLIHHTHTHTDTHTHRERYKHPYAHTTTHTHTSLHTHTPQRYTHPYARTHAHTHTLTHICFCELWGLSIGVMVFILY